MAHCSINLEDAEDGGIAMQVVHTGGFTKNSPAHQLSIQIIKWLDEQAATKQEVANA